MKAERLHKMTTSRVIQPSKGEGKQIVDQRSRFVNEVKLIAAIQKKEAKNNHQNISSAKIKKNSYFGIKQEPEDTRAYSKKYLGACFPNKVIQTFRASVVTQFVKVYATDIGKSFSILKPDGMQVVGILIDISTNGWYKFDVQGSLVSIHGEANILGQTTTVPTFQVMGIPFKIPQTSYTFTATSALTATTPMPHGGWSTLTGAASGSGVKVGDCGSYGAVQYLETTGDGLTGDHQPSGAAIKEAIRLQLHASLNQVLTRSMAQKAYQKAITVVVSDTWHKLSSRTYGGRNTSAQIKADALDLLTASMEDWKKLVPELKKTMTDQEIQNIWDGLCQLRENFFSTGDPQWL